MHWQYSPYSVSLVTAAAVSAVLTCCAWRRRHAPGAMPFILIMLSVVEWSLAYAFELGSADLPTKALWANIKYLGIVTLPTAWLSFALQYTGRARWLTIRNIALLAGVPLVTLLLVWTNDVHGLIWSSIRLGTGGLSSMRISTHGIWFWVHALYSCLLLFLGTILMIQALIRSPRLYPLQTMALLVGILVPWAWSASYIYTSNRFPNLDLTPFAFTLTGLAWAWSLFGFRFLKIRPVAREAVVESMNDVVIVLDARNRIVDFNPAACRVIGQSALQAIGLPAEKVFPRWSDLVERYRNVTEVRSEIVLSEDEKQYFDMSISPLYEKPNFFAGRLIVCRNITQHKQAEEALRQSEQRYRALAESAQDFIFVVDKNGYVQYVNAFAASEFSLRPEELVGKHMNELFPPYWVEQQLKSIPSVYESGRFLNVEHMNVFPKRTLWLNTSLAPLRDGTGKINAVLGISRDITRRKEAEEALQRSEGITKKLAQENSTIAEIGRIISSTLNIEEVYDRFAEVVQKLLPFDRITVSLNNVEDKTVRIAYLTGMDIETVSVGTVIPLAESLNKQLLEKRAAIAIQLESEGGALKPSPPILAYYRAGIRSMISVPLISKGEVIGGLHIGSVKSNAYTEENLRIAEKIAIQISGAIANGQLFNKLKKTEETLRESEERYRLLVGHAMEGICVAQDGQIQFANPRLEETTGYSSEELTSRPFVDFIHPEDREMVTSRHQERLKGELVPEFYQFRFVHRNGEIRWVRIAAAIITWNDKPATLNVLVDITQQRQIEEELERYRHHLEELIEERTAKLEASKEALSRSEQRYREIIETAQEGVWITDVSGKTSYVNHRMAVMMGYPVGQILDRPVSEFMAPESRSIWDQFLRRCVSGMKERYDFRFRTKEGKDIWAMVASAPRYDEGGRFSGALLMVTDISERKQAVENIVTSKKMLQRIFDGISEPLIMLDKDFVVRMLNRVAKDYYQVETFHQIIGKPLLQDFLESDQTGREVRSAVGDGRVLSFERKSPSDPNRFERVVTYPLRENEGMLGDAILRISDITEARLLQREIIQNEKLASLGLLISSVAHEINNPNNFISFNIPVLRDYLQEIFPILDDFANQHPDHELLGMNYHEFREDISKLLGNIEHGTTRISTVVSNLREFSRKKDQEGWRRVHLREVVEKGVAICAGELKKKVKSVDINLSEDLPMVLTDPGAVEQILINLLINAIQATDKGDSWIRVRAILDPSRADFVQIEVSDNGCGMDENTRERIFEPFYTTKSPGTGTGLGLYVSQNLIHELGGDILVESQSGTGSTFTIQLPIEQKREGAPIDSISRVLS